MNVDGRLGEARTAYERAVFGGDTSRLTAAERGLDVVEADVALARGRILHARYLAARAAGASPAEDPAELPLFERAAELYRRAGDVRGEGAALFWTGCLHQVIRRDDDVAVPYLERSQRLAAETGDQAVEAEALRHLGIAAHTAGRLDEARTRLEESARLWREAGTPEGVAANMVGLAYIAAAQGRATDAVAILDEAYAIAAPREAYAVVAQIEQARAGIGA
ncbi:tetratricopeptide repeat protein [Actinoplanes philippinensis]|uniref:tetratricopeptide repeat protein n=1 Tax=Actinoplanes philippinensis TaxID=35752 RepID=UPI0033E4FD9A